MFWNYVHSNVTTEIFYYIFQNNAFELHYEAVFLLVIFLQFFVMTKAKIYRSDTVIDIKAFNKSLIWRVLD